MKWHSGASIRRVARMKRHSRGGTRCRASDELALESVDASRRPDEMSLTEAVLSRRSALLVGDFALTSPMRAG